MMLTLSGRLKDFERSIREHSRRLLRSAGAAIASEVGREEIYFYGALALIAYGCWDLWRPGAFLIPGAVLLWVSLPTRAVFVERRQESKKG